jgi:hypothetical protein
VISVRYALRPSGSATAPVFDFIKGNLSMRTEYEMTEDDLAKLMDASKPTPVMYLSGGRPMYDSPRENANRAWKALGHRMGFNYLTVRPVSGKGQRFFTAEPLTIAVEARD